MTKTRTSSPLLRTLRTPVIAAAAAVLLIGTAAAPAGASHGSTCVTPSWNVRVNHGSARRPYVKTLYQQGLAAGHRAGRQAGYAAGYAGKRLDPSPLRWLPRTCSPRFAQGFRAGFRQAYRDAYRQGVIARRHCRSW